MKLVRGIIWMVLLGCMVMMSGCGEETDLYTENKDTLEKTVLTVYAWQDEEVNLKLLSAAFEEKYQDIMVEIVLVPITEYVQQMMMIKSGTREADCIFFSNLPEAAIWQNKDMLMNLEGYLDEEELKNHYGIWYQEGDEACSKYMVPYRMSRWGVYYNQDVFDKRGVPYPDGRWTWEEYEETARKLTRQVGSDRTWGSLSFEPTSTWWRVPARTAGHNNPLNEEDFSAFMKAAQWCYHLTYDTGAQIPYTAQTGQTGSNYDARFLQGDIGMYFSGDWSAASLNRMIEAEGLDIRYDIAPMPHWEGEEGYVIADAAVLAVVKGTRNEEAALRFLQYVVGEEGAAVLAANNIIPAWNSEEIREIYLSADKYPQHREYFFEEGPISQVPASSSYSEAMEIISQEMALYLLQEQDMNLTIQNIEEDLRPLKQE